jgi:hypothetical protein
MEAILPKAVLNGSFPPPTPAASVLRFALDQNFPTPILNALDAYLTDANLASIAEGEPAAAPVTDCLRPGTLII